VVNLVATFSTLTDHNTMEAVDAGSSPKAMARGMVEEVGNTCPDTKETRIGA
jgi:hypothetical protein